MKYEMRNVVAKKLGHEEPSVALSNEKKTASKQQKEQQQEQQEKQLAAQRIAAKENFADVNDTVLREQCVGFVSLMAAGKRPSAVSRDAKTAGLNDELITRIKTAASAQIAVAAAAKAADAAASSAASSAAASAAASPSSAYLAATQKAEWDGVAADAEAKASAGPVLDAATLKKQALEQAASLRQEALLLKLAQGPGVLKYVGSNIEEGWIVTEWMARGDLERQLQLSLTSEESLFHENHPFNLGAKRAGVEDPVLYQQVRAAREIAIGIQTFHRVGIVHRDLAARNVFLDAALHWKVRRIYTHRQRDICVLVVGICMFSSDSSSPCFYVASRLIDW